MRRSLAALLLLLAAATPALAGGGPADTVVLLNKASADSRRVAEHYAKARQIPAAQVLEVDCTANLEVPMADFVRDVAEPLRELLRRRGLEDRVRFVVLTQGMPIRAKTAAGDVSTTAALALLHTAVCGDAQRGLGARSPAYTGSESQMAQRPTFEAKRFLHVTALLSTTADEAIALADRSVAADGTAPKDALVVFQDANGAAGRRNRTYDAARPALEALGARTTHLPAGADKAVNLQRVIGYVAGGSYSALSVDGVKTNEYLPGALCDFLQSFGAVPQNFGADAARHTQFPVTHMVRAGVTGVHGAVAEPFDIAFPDSDLMTAYLEGATLAETFDARIPVAYWMSLVLGDPLCAPYAQRPKVDVLARGREWSGGAPLTVSAPGAARIDVYVDGTWTCGADGASLDGVVDTERFADGPHRVLVQATGAGQWKPAGWTTLDATFSNPALRALAQPRLVTKTLRVPLSRAPAAGETPTLTLAAGAAPVAGRSSADGDTLVFTPDGPLPPGPLTVSLAGALGTASWTASAAATAVAVETPASVTAGDVPLKLVVTRDGKPLGGWTGRVEVRAADPAVRLVAGDFTADAAGAIALTLPFARAGRFQLRFTLPDDGASATAQIEVRGGEAATATSPLQRVPQGQPVDVDVSMLDATGNPADGWEGELRLAVPGDPAASVPGPARIAADARGRGVFRDVVFAKAGPQGLVISDAAGKTWSQPNEGVQVQHAAIRAWLAASPARGEDLAKFAATDPAKDADRDGCLAGGRIWRRVRARADDILLAAPGARDGDPVAAVAFLDVTTAVRVRLLGACPSRLIVLLDGKTVHDGTPGATDPRGKREPIGTLQLAEGRHRLTAITARAGRGAAFSLEIDDGAGKHVDGVVVVAAMSPDTPSSFVVSGRVRGGGGAAKVFLRPDGGAERAVAPGPDGTWFAAGLPPGEYDVRAEGRSPFQPPARRVKVEGAHVTDVDFVARDVEPPVVKLDGARTKFGRTLLVEPEVSDDDQVREVRLLLDGTEVAKASAAPWRLTADVAILVRGRHEVVVVAKDAAGNEGRSAPLAVTLIDDRKPPVVKVTGLADGKLLDKPAKVTAAVTDDLPIASVRFRLDGKDLGAPRTEAPYTADVDPRGLADGKHSLAVVATDLDGHETLVEVDFRTRK